MMIVASNDRIVVSQHRGAALFVLLDTDPTGSGTLAVTALIETIMVNDQQGITITGSREKR